MKVKFLVSRDKETYLRIGKIKHLVVENTSFNRGVRYSSNKLTNIFNLSCFEECSEQEFNNFYKKTLKSLIF